MEHGLIVASIFETFQNWIIKFFIEDTMISNASDLWNATIESVYAMLGADPSSGSYRVAWELVEKLYITFSAIGSTLLVLFFLWGYCRDVIDIRQDVSLTSTIKIFIRLIIATNVFTYAIDWMPKLFSWAISLLGITGQSAVTINAHKLTAEINATGWGFLTRYLFTWVFFLVVAVCCLVIIISCIGRFIKLYAIVPLATIALSTLAGGGAIAQTGYAYIKTFLTYTFEIVVIGIVLAVSGAFISASSFFDAHSSSSFLIIMEATLKVVAVTAAVKGSEMTIRKALNL